MSQDSNEIPDNVPANLEPGTEPTAEPETATDEEGDQERMRESFAILTETSRELVEHVQALTETLKVVNGLQQDMMHQRERQDSIDKEIALNRAASEDRDTRTRRTLTFAGVCMGILLPLVSILIYAALINHVNDLLDGQKKGFYTTCLTRNQATQDNITREKALADADKDAQVEAIHNESAQDLAKSIVDCTKYLKD